MIKCEICKKDFHQITFSHLKKAHNISVYDYRILYPNASLMSEELREKQALYCKEQNKNENFGFKKNHKINKNKEPWNKGKTKETDDRIFSSSKKLKGRKFSYEQRQKLSKSKKDYYKNNPDKKLIGPKNGMYGKKLSEKHLNALLNISIKKNKVEELAEKRLKNLGFKYSGDRKFWVTFKDGTHKNPDFISFDRKCVIEIYGDYWRKNDNPKDIIEKYKEIGWNCIVYWEHQVKSRDFTIDAILQDLNEWEFEDFTYNDFNGGWML